MENLSLPFKRKPHKMVKHTQAICRQKPTNCLSVFDHFVGLALKGLRRCKVSVIATVVMKHQPFPSQPRMKRKNKLKPFIFTLICGASKVFMKALTAFIKPSEALQRSAKINIRVNFYFNITF